MRFKTEYIPLIIEGKKTRTVRIGKAYEMEVGKKYPVFDAMNGKFQKNKDAICWIKCNMKYTERYGGINRKEALEEGFKTLKEFKNAIKNIYGNIDKDRRVVVYEFEVVEK